jgi:hypothetical protein
MPSFNHVAESMLAIQLGHSSYGLCDLLICWLGLELRPELEEGLKKLRNMPMRNWMTKANDWATK